MRRPRKAPGKIWARYGRYSARRFREGVPGRVSGRGGIVENRFLGQRFTVTPPRLLFLWQ